MPPRPRATVNLYWIPLGAGGHSVRFNGRVFEAIEAARPLLARRDGPGPRRRGVRPRRLSSDPQRARRLLELVPRAPTPKQADSRLSAPG
jgi:hypothetical protein